MKAVVYKGPFEVAVEDVDDPVIQDPTDVIVKITRLRSVDQICTHV